MRATRRAERTGTGPDVQGDTMRPPPPDPPRTSPLAFFMLACAISLADAGRDATRTVA
jgi:hypothetical protein